MYYIITVIVILIILLVIIYNTMLSKQNKLKSSYSSLDVMLKRRYDLIPNIVDTVKAYAKYEQETLERVTSLRRRADECNNSKELENVDREYNGFMNEVNLLSEQYPDLKASENFVNLQKVLAETEEQISAARRTYNAHVEDFNTYISMIPFNIFAKMFKFKKYDFFEIEESEREVKISME